MQPRPGAVDRARHLRRRACEIRRETLVRDGDAHAHGDGLVSEAVIVHEVLRFPGAFGQRLQRVAGDELALAEQALDAGAQRVSAVAFTDGANAHFADTDGGHAGVEIAERHIRQAHVGSDEVDDVRQGLAGLVDAHGGQLQAFLVNLGGVCRPAAGRHAADFGPVALVGREGHQLASMDDRADQADVAEVGAAAGIGVIGGEDVSSAHVGGAKLVQNRAHGKRQDAGEARHALGLGDQLGLRRQQGAGVIQHLINDGAFAGAAKTQEALVRRSLQLFLNDGQGEGVMRHGRAPPPYRRVTQPWLLRPHGPRTARRRSSAAPAPA